MSATANIWSRRRAAVQAEVQADEKLRDYETAQAECAALEQKSDAEILAELELNDPDDMVAGDDFSAFMKATVPERLRRRALRKLWLSNPVLANVDNLVDYGEDFTGSGDMIGAVKTAYQVGRGMEKHVIEMEERQAALAAEKELQHADPAVDLPEIQPAEQDLADPIQETLIEPPEKSEIEEADDSHPILVRRRMRFAFTNQTTGTR